MTCVQWKIEQISDNLSDGYFVKNQAEGVYLGMEVATRPLSGAYSVVALDKPYPWFVLRSQPAQGEAHIM